MAFLDQLVISLRTQLCLAGMSEDEIQQFVNALQIKTVDDSVTFVTSTGGNSVQFLFGSDGNFMGAYAQLAGVSLPIIFGTGSTNLEVFKGSPSGTNPGPGWEVEVELTQKYLSQSGPEADWEIFYASRVPLVSTIP